MADDTATPSEGTIGVNPLGDTMKTSTQRLLDRWGPDDEDRTDPSEASDSSEEDGEVLEEVLEEETEQEVAEEPESAEETEEGAESGEWLLTDLVAAGETTPEQVKVTVTVAGVPQEVSLAELQNGYQRQADYDRNNRELRERKEKFDTEAEERTKSFNAVMSVVIADWQKEQKDLEDAYQSVPWAQLRMEDEASFAARHAEFQDARTQLQMRRQRIRRAVQQHMEANQQRLTAALDESKKAERQKLSSLNPEWADESKYLSGMAGLRTYLHTTYGVPEKQMENIFDAVTLDLFRKAMLYDQGQQKVQVTKKKLAKRKLLRPGARSGPSAESQVQEGKLRDKLKKSGSQNDAVALLRHRLGG